MFRQNANDRVRLAAEHDLASDDASIRREFSAPERVADNSDGVVLDYQVMIGNPSDAPLLAPAIERIKRGFGKAPRAVTADRGSVLAGPSFQFMHIEQLHMGAPEPDQPLISKLGQRSIRGR